jgi:predicted transcriptional regulator
MRTTLEIDDDVLEAAKELAKAQKTTAGQVISDLARQALTRTSGEPAEYRNGFRLLPRAGKVITSEMVERWLEEDV